MATGLGEADYGLFNKVGTKFRLLGLMPVIVSLLGCGQLSLVLTLSIAPVDTRSNLKADYSPWTYAVIHLVAQRCEILTLQNH